ncbi:MAG: histidine kinase [Cyclobacteriaceae bacterium]|nr:histidine kinase [Cyclobacteriaceae bacterium]
MLGYTNTRKFLRTYSIILGGTFVAFCVRLVKFDIFTLRQHIGMHLISLALMIILWESLRAINTKLNRAYPYERSISNRIIFQLALGILLGALVRALIYFFGEPLLPFRLDSLFLAATWFIYILAPTLVNLGFFTNYFLNRWKDSLVQTERLEKEKSQVQFDNLKNQLNPHFLFNALTSLNTLIFEDQKLASEFLQQLSKVYRYVLQNKDKNFVSVKTELDFIRHYIQLLETRFRGSLTISVQISAQAHEQAIVPVTLQILIENAIKHNIMDREKPLVIEILTIGDYLVVSNNLQVRKVVESSNKQGLENLKALYRFLTTKPVLVESGEDRFYVKVPLL